MKSHISIIALIAAVPAIAQDVVDLPEISLTANFDAVEIDRTGASVTVIGEDEIEQSGDIKLTDYLNSIAGVSVDSNGPMGSVTSVAIRGARNENISVFVDGIRVDDPTTVKGGFNFGSLTTNNIQQVEVLRGSQSALYGGSAIGGVIDITTKTAKKDGISGSANIEYGSYNTLNGALSLGYLGNGNEFAINYGQTQSDGFSAYDDGSSNLEADGFAGQEFSLKYVRALTLDYSAGFNGFYKNSEYDFDSTTGDNPDNNGTDTQTGLRGFVKYDNGSHSEELSYTYTKLEREQNTTSDFGPYTYTTQGSRNELNYIGHFVLTNAVSVNYGGNYRNEAIELTDGSTIKTDSVAAFGGVNFRPNDRLDLELSGRFEDHSSFGGLSSMRASMAWEFAPEWIMRGVASTGYRAPTPYELYDEYYGNPDLKPETSQSYEIGLERKYGEQGSIGVTAFHITSEDYLDWDPATYKATNISGTTTRQGLELQSAYALSDALNFGLNYAYTQTENADGERLARVPLHNANLYMNADLSEKLSTKISANYVSDNIDRVYGEETKLDDYVVVNARLGYEIGNGEAFLRIENLFNEDYSTAANFGKSDRAYYVGYSLDF